MEGCLFAALFVSLWYIPKAVLEVCIFKDREGAKRTLFLWGISIGSIGFAFGISLLIDYLG